MRPYPTRNGLIVPPSEVLLPTSHLKDRRYNYNLHHGYFSKARYYGGGVIYATLRDLETTQFELPKDVHNFGKGSLHALYGPPEVPKPGTAVDFIFEAYCNGDQLRYGHIGRPEYVPISHDLMNSILNASFTEANRAMH